MQLFLKVIKSNLKLSFCKIVKFISLLPFVKINVFCVLQDLLIVTPWQQWSSRTPWILGKLTWAKCCRKRWIFWLISTNHSTNNLLNCWVIVTTCTIYFDFKTNFRRSSVRCEGPTLSQTFVVCYQDLFTYNHSLFLTSIFCQKHLTVYNLSSSV